VSMHHSNWVRKHLLLKILQFLCFCLFERLPRRKSIRSVHVCVGNLVCSFSANSPFFLHINVLTCARGAMHDFAIWQLSGTSATRMTAAVAEKQVSHNFADHSTLPASSTLSGCSAVSSTCPWLCRRAWAARQQRVCVVGEDGEAVCVQRVFFSP
jgi:hypothetical protein